jgi:hypothetical protein
MTAAVSTTMTMPTKLIMTVILIKIIKMYKHHLDEKTKEKDYSHAGRLKRWSGDICSLLK